MRTADAIIRIPFALRFADTTFPKVKPDPAVKVPPTPPLPDNPMISGSVNL
jgi:hypothetical protein